MTVKIKVTGYLYLEESEGADPNNESGMTAEGYDRWVVDGGATLQSLEDVETTFIAVLA
jgi:hypothetical protein